MWNSFRTDAVPTMTVEMTTYAGAGGDQVLAYLARPGGAGPFPAVLLVHHLPGWDEFHQEFTRRFANHGFIAMCPNLFIRQGNGSPDDVAAKVRAEGGLSDDQVVADCEAAMKWLKSQPTSNGKVGIIGACSAGRHATLVASRVAGFDAVADLWGGGVVTTPDKLTPKQPVAPVDYVADLNAPLIGLFGNDDMSPSPADVDQFEAALKAAGKNYVFYRYDGAGHGFFYYDRPNYRIPQALDGWNKVNDFFDQYLKA